MFFSKFVENSKALNLLSSTARYTYEKTIQNRRIDI